MDSDALAPPRLLGRRRPEVSLSQLVSAASRIGKRCALILVSLAAGLIVASLWIRSRKRRREGEDVQMTDVPAQAQGASKETHDESRPAANQERQQKTAVVRAGLVDISLGVTVLGLLSYGLARFLVDGFLAPFHLSFDEIGLDYGKLVATGILFTIPSVVVIMLAYRISDNIWRRIAPPLMNARTEAGRLIAFTLVYALAAAFLTLLYIVAGRYLDVIPLPDKDRQTWGGTLRLVLLAVLISAIVALLFDSRGSFRNYWRRAVRSMRAAPPGQMLPAFWRLTGGVVTSLVLFSAFCFTAYSLGVRYADTVEAGRRLNVTVLGLRLPGVAAKPVKVVMLDGASPTPLPNGSCLLLIGERGETDLLYDFHEKLIYRVSTQNMYTVEDTDAEGCQAATTG
jgi:hypothetical protein